MTLRANSRILFLTTAGASLAMLAGPLPALASPASTPAISASSASPSAQQSSQPSAFASASVPTYPRLTQPLPTPVLPVPGAADVQLAGPGERVPAGTLPVQVAAVDVSSPLSVRVTVLSTAVTQAVRGQGVSLVVRRTDGGAEPAPVRLTLDYSAWRHLAGANFAGRLAIRAKSLCQLYAADATACAESGLVASENDQVAGALTFEGLALPDPSADAAPAAPSESASPSAGPIARESAPTPTPTETSAAGRRLEAAAEDSPSPEPTASASSEPTASATPDPSAAPSSSPEPSPSGTVGPLNPTQAAVCEASSDPTAPIPSWCVGGAEPDPESGGQTGMFTTTSTSSGTQGTFKVANMIDPHQWAGGLQSGDFTYGYSVPMPPSIGGSAPDVTLGYSAQSVDGRTSSQNAQGSVFGMGWDYTPGYVTQSFMGCGEQDTNTGMKVYADLCEVDPMRSDVTNFSLTLGGKTARLFTDGTTWRMEDDEGWKITPLGGQKWLVQTVDGTKYYFGLGTNGPNGTVPTNSLWTVPVFATQNTSCNTAGNYCWKAWRANLDAIVDPNGNLTYFTYVKRTNRYFSDQTQFHFDYARGGYVGGIYYGVPSSAPKADYSSAARMVFTATGRCTQQTQNPPASCPAAGSTIANWGSYPDTPVDLICSTTCEQRNPSFFETERIDSVTVSVAPSGGSTYLDVDKIYFDHTFPASPPNDDPDPSVDDAQTPNLWLAGIRRVGSDIKGVGGDIAVPTLSFTPVLLPNRVNTDAYFPPVDMPRINQITTETGEKIYPTMGNEAVGSACTATSLPTQETNTRLCFPQRYQAEDATKPARTDWHFKYVLEAVNIKRPTVAGTPDELWDYQYSVPSTTGVLWDWDFNAGTNHHMFSNWRGVAKVRTVHGSATGTQSTTDRWYFTGLRGHPTATDGTGSRSNSIITTWDGDVWDDPLYVGRLIQDSYNSSGGADLISNLHTWTNTNTLAGTPAAFRRETSTVTETALPNAVKRYSRVLRDYDDTGATPNGLLVSEHLLGEVSAKPTYAPLTSLDRCTTYAYAKNPATWLIGYVSQVDVHDGNCNAALIGQRKTFYDGLPFNDPPVEGNATLNYAYTSAGQYQQTGAAYDGYGRAYQFWDKPVDSANLTVTDFGADGCVAGSPAICRHPSLITVTTPENEVTKSENFSWARGIPLKITDPNDKVTLFEIDRLGRGTARIASGDGSGCKTEQWTYTLTATAPLRIMHQQLRTATGSGATCTLPTFLTDYTFFDAGGRTIQSQTASPAGSGRVLSLTDYDARGLAVVASEPFHNTGTAGAFFDRTTLSTEPNRVVTDYDELRRPTDVITMSGSTELWRSQMQYLGDAVLTTPPSGALMEQTKTWIDVFGRNWRTDEYEWVNGIKQTNRTTTTFDRAGNAVDLTDPQNVLTHTDHDWLGQPTWVTNPNSGTRDPDYDSAGNLTSVVRDGVAVVTAFDAQHRPTETSAGGAPRRKWSYGLGTSATDKGLNQVGRVKTTTSYDAGGFTVPTSTEYDTKGRISKHLVSPPWTYGSPAQTLPTILRGGVTSTFSYDRADNVTRVSYSTKAGMVLGAETVETGYDANGLPSTLKTVNPTTGAVISTFISQHEWYGNGRLHTRHYNAGGNTYFKRNYTWDSQVGSRLWGRSIQQVKNGVTSSLQNENFGYDPLGNPVEIKDVNTSQYQCFDYDHRGRLIRAFTAPAACAAPGTDLATGTDGYNTRYSHDRERNALSAVSQLDDLGNAVSTKSYTYAGPQPHGASTLLDAGVTSTLDYDEGTGELFSRTVAGVSTTHDWDNLGQLEKTTTGSAASVNIYDAAGNRVLHRAAGVTTLSMGGQEISVADANPTAFSKEVRSYDLAGTPVAAKIAVNGAAAKLFWTFNDRQNSAEVTVDDAAVKAGTAGAVVTQRYTPFGARRSGSGLPHDKDFLNKTRDAETGLHHVGARYYNADDGLFISTDPLAGVSGTASLNPYVYAGNNPVRYSDPTGLSYSGDDGAQKAPTTILRAPRVSNTELQDLFRRDYADPEKIKNGITGDGTTASAVEYELANGRPVGKTYHANKAMDLVNGYGNLLEKDRRTRANGDPGALTLTERAMATDRLKALWRALTMDDVTGNVGKFMKANPGRMEALQRSYRAAGENYSLRKFTGHTWRTPANAMPQRSGGGMRTPGWMRGLGVVGELAIPFEMMLRPETNPFSDSYDACAGYSRCAPPNVWA